jgi:N4-gp56 family major capsid protein
MADMGVTETSAAGQDIVSAVVQTQLEASAQLIFTIQDESARATKGAKSVSFPRAGALDPADKAENTPTTTQALTYAADQLLLTGHVQTLVRLEDIASVQAIVDVEADILKRAATGMAKKFDTAIYTALRDGASASAPDHIVALSSGGTALDEAAILGARKLLDLQNVPADDRFMVVSPYQEAQLLAIANFIQAERYGSNMPIMNGELGRVFGFRVIKTTVAASAVVLCYHRSACAFARQVDPKWEAQRAPLEYLADNYSLSSLYGVKVLDSGKRNVTLNASGS